MKSVHELPSFMPLCWNNVLAVSLQQSLLNPLLDEGSAVCRRHR
jgi:hypothetical protein